MGLQYVVNAVIANFQYFSNLRRSISTYRSRACNLSVSLSAIKWSYSIIGYFLGNIFDSLARVGCSIVLRTNHRSEAALIVENATTISNQEVPVIDPHRHFHQINIGQDGEMEEDPAEEEDLSCGED